MDEQKIQMMLAAVIDLDYPKFYSLFDELMTEKLEAKIRQRANNLGFLFEPGMTIENEGEPSALFDFMK